MKLNYGTVSSLGYSSPKTKGVIFVNSDLALTTKELYTAPLNGGLITSVIAASTDTAARVFDVLVFDGTSEILLGSVSVAITAGTTGTIAVQDLIAASIFPGLAIDETGKPIIILKAGDILRVRNQTQLTAAKTVSIFSQIFE